MAFCRGRDSPAKISTSPNVARALRTRGGAVWTTSTRVHTAIPALPTPSHKTGTFPTPDTNIVCTNVVPKVVGVVVQDFGLQWLGKPTVLHVLPHLTAQPANTTRQAAVTLMPGQVLDGATPPLTPNAIAVDRPMCCGAPYLVHFGGKHPGIRRHVVHDLGHDGEEDTQHDAAGELHEHWVQPLRRRHGVNVAVSGLIQCNTNEIMQQRVEPGGDGVSGRTLMEHSIRLKM